MKKKFNIVDAILILLIVAALAACFLFLRARGKVASDRVESPMRFTVELREVQKQTVAQYEAGIGKNIYRSTDGVYLGTLVDVSYETYTETEYSQSLERYVTYDCDELCTAYLTVEGSGYETEKDVMVSGVSVKIGDELYIKGKGYAGKGYVVMIDTMDGEAVEDSAVGLGDTQLLYTVQVSDVREFTANGFRVGDRLYDKTTGAVLGTITDIAVEPYYVYEMGADGTGVRVAKGDRCEIILTLDGRCTETDNSYYIDGRCELKVGAELTVTTKFVNCEIYYRELLGTTLLGE